MVCHIALFAGDNHFPDKVRYGERLMQQDVGNDNGHPRHRAKRLTWQAKRVKQAGIL
jgi:hypothetical protein